MNFLCLVKPSFPEKSYFHPAGHRLPWRADKIPPPTPLLDGMPTRTANSPEPSYIPQVNMSVLTILTAWLLKSRFPVCPQNSQLWTNLSRLRHQFQPYPLLPEMR